MDHLPPRSVEGTLKLMRGHRKGRTKPCNLREQVDSTTMKMWRTPDAVSGGSNLPGIKKALDQGHLKRPSGQPIQIRLHDQVREKRLWPTPNASDHRDRGNLSDPAIQRRIKLGKQVGLTMAVKELHKYEAIEKTLQYHKTP